MSLCEATYTRTSHLKMLSNARFNNSTNVNAKWKENFLRLEYSSRNKYQENRIG
jgi:hypothetical protein